MSVKLLSHAAFAGYFLLPFAALAAHQKSHAAHEHGVAKAHFAADGKRALFEFESPAESIYGFERAPKTEKEKKKIQEASDVFASKISEIVKISGAGPCTWKVVHWDPAVSEHQGDTHLEVRGSFEALCAQDLAGKAQVTFAFSPRFPSLKSVKIQVLSEKKQLAVEASAAKPAVVDL